jgi:hypothetical protein
MQTHFEHLEKDAIKALDAKTFRAAGNRCYKKPFADRAASTRGRCYDLNFLQFSAKKLAFFTNNNVMIKFVHNLALF